MNLTKPDSVGKTTTNDTLMWDILQGIVGYEAVLVAFDLGLFSLLDQEPRTLDAICAELELAPRAGEVLVTVCLSVGLIRVEDNSYFLEPVAEDHLLDRSPTHFGSFIAGLISNQNQSVFSYESVKRAFMQGKSQAYGGEPIFESHEKQVERARVFTDMMHGHSMGPAREWPASVNLGQHRIMLDIGGGSGAHAIGAAQRWPNLQAMIVDLAPVCDVAKEYIAQYDMQNRIRTHVADMWTDPFPAADVHFYANIFHDWPVEKGRFLTEKSFRSLESNGRIIVHEMLYNDEKTGPLAVAGFSVGMLLWSEGKQYSGPELSEMLSEVGFVDIEVKPTHGYWSIVTGRKP